MSRASWYSIKAQEETAEVSIFGDIGASWWGDSVTLADFKKDFDTVKNKSSIRLLLNSPGGSVFDGIAIYNVISTVRQKVSVEVLGMAASIASVIALAGKELTMGEGSYFMIHKPWSFSMGTADQLRKDADLLDSIDGQMVSIYAQHSALTDEEISEAMAEETWYTADEAVEAGFAAGIADYGEMAASYDLSKYKYAHAPVEMAEGETPSDKPEDIRDFESRVRGMGFSKREAKAIASHGFPQRDAAPPEVEQTEAEVEAPTLDDSKVHAVAAAKISAAKKQLRGDDDEQA